jgi:hypothetical protein
MHGLRDEIIESSQKQGRLTDPAFDAAVEGVARISVVVI